LADVAVVEAADDLPRRSLLLIFFTLESGFAVIRETVPIERP
jgi:hypothetical protein